MIQKVNLGFTLYEKKIFRASFFFAMEIADGYVYKVDSKNAFFWIKRRENIKSFMQLNFEDFFYVLRKKKLCEHLNWLSLTLNHAMMIFSVR